MITLTAMSIQLDLTFWEWVEAIIFVLFVGVVSGRILGVRRGFWRSTIAGFLGTFIGLVISAVILQGQQPADIDTFNFLVVVFGFATLATMLLSIVLEVILRPRRIGRRPRLWTRLRTFSTVGGRLWEVSRIARRHGLAGPRLANRSALTSADGGARIRGFLEDCGGVFIKFGQIASTRSDLLPPPVIIELSNLQSNVRPVPSDQVRHIVESSLGRPISEVFGSFSDEPLAAASIGQTHLAELLDGTQVVVKVRRPEVALSVARDSAVLRWATRMAVRRSEAARSLGLVALSDELIRSVELELDYLNESVNARALTAASADHPGVTAPSIFSEFTTDAVLVMERVNGRPVSDSAAVDACPIPRPELAERLLSTFMDHVLRGGIFHADPHPGNILIDAEGTLWLIDFGAVGLIDPVTLESLQSMGAGLATGQPGLVARGLRTISGPAGDAVNPQALESEISRVLSEQLHSPGFDPAALQKVVELMRRNGLPVPSTFTLLARAMVTVAGTLQVIDPKVDFAAAAAAQVGGAMAAAGEPKEILQREVLRMIPSLRSLPGLAEDISLQLRAGRIMVGLDPFSGPSRRVVSYWLDQSLFAVVGAVGLLASALMLAGAAIAEPNTDGGLTAVGYIGLVISAVMLMRVVAQIVRRQGDDAAIRRSSA